MLQYTPMKKLVITSIAVLAIVLLGVFLFIDRSAEPAALSGCDQSATTTDCAKLAELYPSDNENYVPPEYKWRQYTNKEFGISFEYPSDIDQNWMVGSGDTGEQFGGTIELPSKSDMSFTSLTKDYTAPKDGVMVGTEGYVIKDGKYYSISRGRISDTPFVPDEILKLKDGTPVLILYKKTEYPGSDYQPPDVAAMINLPNNKKFTGMGFMLYLRSYPTKVENPEEDIATFKKFVTSVEFVK